MKTNPDLKHLRVIELSEDTHIVVPDKRTSPLVPFPSSSGPFVRFDSDEVKSV